MQALQECIHSKKDIVQPRLTWAKNQSLEVLGKHDKAKLRGMHGTKSIPNVITRQIRWKTLHEERQAIITAWDKDAKAVTRAAENIKSKPGRPEWIRLAGILRESGNMAEKIMACREAPATKAALNNHLDTHETVYQRRLVWAEAHQPDILKLSPYEKKCTLGLRGWKKTLLL